MKERGTFTVIKANGESVPFSEKKLINSLKHTGAGDQEINNVLTAIGPRLHEGISTKKIYRMAFKLLKESSRYLAAKYHLKKAIMELGPSGYPFEKFIGELLKHQGFNVKVGQIIQGKCVQHEVDVVAQKKEQFIMVECKYHNLAGTVCDVKIPLYIQARFKDIEAVWLSLPGHINKFHQGWLVTNTRFSGDAIQYGKCAGLHLLGWDYPQGNGLKELIDNLGLYPITCLTTLTSYEKQDLLNKCIVLCQELRDNHHYLEGLNLSSHRKNLIMNEVEELARFLAPMPEVHRQGLSCNPITAYYH